MTENSATGAEKAIADHWSCTSSVVDNGDRRTGVSIAFSCGITVEIARDESFIDAMPRHLAKAQGAATGQDAVMHAARAFVVAGRLHGKHQSAEDLLRYLEGQFGDHD